MRGEHFKNICPSCGSISQCKCFDCNKILTNNLCQKCKDLINKELEEGITKNSCEVWICGKDTLPDWEFQGVFTTKQRAIDACFDENCFIAPAILDEELPKECECFPGIEYPLRKISKLIIPKVNKIKLAQADEPTIIECETGKVSDGYHTFDELYEHRITLYIALCKSLTQTEGYNNGRIWRSKFHSDGTNFPGWFILGINRGHGKQITYHLPENKWEKCEFATTLSMAPEWDYHTPQDVLKRLENL